MIEQLAVISGGGHAFHQYIADAIIVKHLAVNGGHGRLLVQGPYLNGPVIGARHQTSRVDAGVVHTPYALVVLLKLHHLRYEVGK